MPDTGMGMGMTRLGRGTGMTRLGTIMDTVMGMMVGLGPGVAGVGLPGLGLRFGG
jgi:hypothetical protein